MERIPISEPQTPLEALALMREALHLLDLGGAPADIGAHLDLAIVRLDQWLSSASICTSATNAAGKMAAPRLEGESHGG